MESPWTDCKISRDVNLTTQSSSWYHQTHRNRFNFTDSHSSAIHRTLLCWCCHSYARCTWSTDHWLQTHPRWSRSTSSSSWCHPHRRFLQHGLSSPHHSQRRRRSSRTGPVARSDDQPSSTLYAWWYSTGDLYSCCTWWSQSTLARLCQLTLIINGNVEFGLA